LILGFHPALPFFTYGVPNRVGLNQYGAKGRADSGQDMETILRAYYNYDNLSGVDTNIKIRVDGHGEYSA
jgi:peptidoglycan hydrolase-like amidase